MSINFIRTKIILFTILFFSFTCQKTFAKALETPTLEEAVKKSNYIVVAEYLGYTKDAKIYYSHGPLAKYKVIKILKGEEVSGIIQVRYEFNDRSYCLPEKDWRFSDNLMPKKDSQWILFLERKDDDKNTYFTYRGDYGRLILNEINLQKIINIEYLRDWIGIQYVNDSIVNVILKKIADDYQKQEVSYKDKMPKKISVALVEQKYNNGNPLNMEENIKRHWIWENGVISNSDIKMRKEFGGDKTYPRKVGFATFAIFVEKNKITVQLDENWFAQNGEGILYEVITEPDDGISLKVLEGLWQS